MKIKITKLESGIIRQGESTETTDKVEKRLLDAWEKNGFLPDPGLCILCKALTFCHGALVHPKAPHELSDGSYDFYICKMCIELPDVQLRLQKAILSMIKQKTAGLN